MGELMLDLLRIVAIAVIFVIIAVAFFPEALDDLD
jgi:hypothetical protein